ncbi:uncharacterized protein Z519_09545 [Cladophialophora bantiana CBS 173.52]|uniref:NAD(P)-binding protein n=1 Tax=Cladophialophora bantiana (strain ATCC 10958 / CBS 173.52 / CDC B-1940 / NIH 8579) TaxID=1442370 RepID=A0A0D2HZV0_CLAB1|nr:uncharacterized protein Z519_09545 [Cladophialophora bantiana CBS 173.52]KIW90114.1 hypothetical protein Z519_09545 [Cladophialophora bantiana CBS 173.52]
MSIYNVCAVVGASTIGYFGFQLASALRFQLHASKLQRYHHGPDPWALVSGASDGIGLAFVRAFAARGFNVVLHGRNEAKLEKIIAELQQQYKTTSFRTLVLDAGTPASPAFDETVLAAVKDINLTVVVHNVAGSGDPKFDMALFEDIPARLCDGWINVNARFTTHLTRLLLPILLQNQPGLMLFVSSAVTEVTAPYTSLYTGTKCYIEGLAKCLRLEMALKGHDVEMMALLTGTVATASSGRSDADISFTMPSTSAFVKASLDKVGWGSPRVTPWIGHGLQFGFMKMLPAWARDQMLLRIVKKVQDGVAKRD